MDDGADEGVLLAACELFPVLPDRLGRFCVGALFVGQPDEDGAADD